MDRRILLNTVKLCCTILLLGIYTPYIRAQDSTMAENAFAWRCYLETYYSYDFSKPASHRKAAFLYNFNRHNEVNVNLALASISYQSKKARATLGLMTGTYAQYNLAAEPGLLQLLFEANAGIKLAPGKDLWLDLGILPSHIGFESAIGKDSWTLTRSLLAENSPYYEAGARLSYSSNNNKLYAAALLLNGWQRITRAASNNSPAFGTQLSYRAGNKLLLNWSSFVGNDQPDSLAQWRYFNNLFAVWKLSKKWGITLGFDYGLQQKAVFNSSALHKWYSPVAIVRYQYRDWAVAARAEYYHDPAAVIVPLVNAQQFRMQGYSLNIDRSINANALFRMEWRMLKNNTGYFNEVDGLSSRNHAVTGSLMIDFRNK